MNSTPTEPDPLAEAEKAGFDLHLMRENLGLTPHQRTVQHAAALALVEQLERARTKLYGNAQPTSPTGHRSRD